MQLKEEVDYQEQSYNIIKNGSLIFMALASNKCVATVRASHSDISKLEFDYLKYFPNKKLFEISKLITHKNYREGWLTKLIMMHTQFYGYNNCIYDEIVINSSVQLVNYYQRIGFAKIIEDKIIHPTIGNESYLLHCSNKNFQKTALAFQKILEQKNSSPIKTK